MATKKPGRIPHLPAVLERTTAQRRRAHVLSLQDCRRIATRFDRNIKIFMGAVSLAAFVTWWL